jgi:hypothetical protein
MSQQNGTKDKDATRSFAHQKNIERYRKLLRTYLTDNERLFVQRRLAEEQAALRQLGMADVLSQVGLGPISGLAAHK